MARQQTHLVRPCATSAGNLLFRVRVDRLVIQILDVSLLLSPLLHRSAEFLQQLRVIRQQLAQAIWAKVLCVLIHGRFVIATWHVTVLVGAASAIVLVGAGSVGCYLGL